MTVLNTKSKQQIFKRREELHLKKQIILKKDTVINYFLGQPEVLFLIQNAMLPSILKLFNP